jgi:asparagine synthase (glutamine-hydrolysing)
MTETLRHRGPDDHGEEIIRNDNVQIAFGHSRLSIIDLSPLGHQPMHYENLSIVFNGEIYNYKEIKQKLTVLGHTFVSTSDTEVILHSFKQWGCECVKEFIGIFAFVIYENNTNKIYMFRDRVGAKPLYWYRNETTFMFASELKSFHKHPLFKKEIDFPALNLYMQYFCVPSPYCIFKNARKLNAGSYIILNIEDKQYKEIRYWNVKDFYERPKLKISYKEAIEETERLLTSAFNYRMIADVPVGVFLSAGYDSSCVAALLQKDRTEKLRTYTIGFYNGNDEAPRAKAIAKYLGTEHKEYYCSAKEMLDIVPNLPFIYDEPFADNSQIATTLVSKMARQDVSVVLSADGGDEIFAGYKQHEFLLNSYQKINYIPQFFKPIAKIAVEYLANVTKDDQRRRRYKILENVLNSNNCNQYNKLISSVYTVEKIHDFGNKKYTQDFVANSTLYDEDLTRINDILSMILCIDYQTELVDQMNVKVDRATMSVSLEGREPFLDQRIVEFVAQLPSEYKYKDGVKKRILKDIVYKYIPKNLMDMPKSGFNTPVALWLQNELKDYMNTFLCDKNVKDVNVFTLSYIRKVKESFERNPIYNSTEIWKILQFYSWYNTWMK